MDRDRVGERTACDGQKNLNQMTLVFNKMGFPLLPIDKPLGKRTSDLTFPHRFGSSYTHFVADLQSQDFFLMTVCVRHCHRTFSVVLT